MKTAEEIIQQACSGMPDSCPAPDRHDCKSCGIGIVAFKAMREAVGPMLELIKKMEFANEVMVEADDVHWQCLFCGAAKRNQHQPDCEWLAAYRHAEKIMGEK